MTRFFCDLHPNEYFYSKENFLTHLVKVHDANPGPMAQQLDLFDELEVVKYMGNSESLEVKADDHGDCGFSCCADGADQ